MLPSDHPADQLMREITQQQRIYQETYQEGSKSGKVTLLLELGQILAPLADLTPEVTFNMDRNKALTILSEVITYVKEQMERVNHA